MPLLDIKATRKVTVICSLEESTAIQVDQYAAFANAPADEVVNKALEYAFGKDSEFQKFRVSNPNAPQLSREEACLSVDWRAARTEASIDGGSTSASSDRSSWTAQLHVVQDRRMCFAHGES